MTIIDTNHNVTPVLARLKAAGITTVIRYVAAGLVGNEKVVKPAEARAIREAGMRLALVYEISGRPSGTAVGRRDGQFFAGYAPTVGAPPGVAVAWYTVDYDAGPSDYPGILAACKAFKAACNAAGYKVGIYASGYISDRLTEDGGIDEIGGVPLIWLTDSLGFRGSRDSLHAGRYVMAQSLPRITASIDNDLNTLNTKIASANMNYVGDFGPDVVYVDPSKVVGSIAWSQASLDAIGAVSPWPGFIKLDVDGVEGPKTLGVVESFQRANILVVDGIVGNNTIDCIKSALAKLPAPGAA